MKESSVLQVRTRSHCVQHKSDELRESLANHPPLRKEWSFYLTGVPGKINMWKVFFGFLFLKKYSLLKGSWASNLYRSLGHLKHSSYLSGFKVFTVTLKGKKKKKITSTILTLNSETRWNILLALFSPPKYSGNPPNHKILKCLNVRLALKQRKGVALGSWGGPGLKGYGKKQNLLLSGACMTHTQDWSNKSFWSLRPGHLLLLPHHPRASPRPSTGTDNTEFSLNPESLRHIKLLTCVPVATLPKAPHAAL